MPERGQGNLKTPGFLLVFSLLLGKLLGFATDYSGDGSLVIEEAIPLDPVEVYTELTIIEPGETYSSTMGDPQIPPPPPSATAEMEGVVSPEFLLMVGIPLLCLLLLSLLVVFLVRHNKRRKSKPDELGSENIKSPIFEEDTPSVMEIEMEELDKWMSSINRNAECECLPTVKEEEKESNHHPSDAES